MLAAIVSGLAPGITALNLDHRIVDRGQIIHRQLTIAQYSKQDH